MSVNRNICPYSKANGEYYFYEKPFGGGIAACLSATAEAMTAHVLFAIS